MSHDINKESKQTGICHSFACQKLLMGKLPKLFSAKHSCYIIHGIMDYLVNIKFGELAHNANWRTYNLGSSDIECGLLIYIRL